MALIKGMGVGHRSQRETYWNVAIRSQIPADQYPEEQINRVRSLNVKPFVMQLGMIKSERAETIDTENH